MTPREIKRIKRTLDTLEAGFAKRALQHFATILPEIEPFVEDVLRTGNADGFEMPGKKRYLVLFKRYIQECFVQGMNLADQELLARRARFDDQKQQPPPVIPEEAMAWMDRWTERFGPDYYGDLTQDVVGTLKRALGEGLSTQSTMAELEHVLTGPAYNKNRLDVIARTNATTAFNQGRLEMFNQDPDFVPYVEFLAILDSRTTDICEARNGKIFRTGSADLAANTPPLHYRCRSILSPVTIYDLEDMQKAGWKDPEGKTLQQKMDLGGMPELPKGFGSVGRNVPVKSEKVVTEAPRSGIIDGKGIDVEIDELTPCLRNRKTNEIVDTEYNQITKQSEIKKISKEQKWDFNWEKQWRAKESNSEFYALTIKGENATQGIIEVRTHQGATELRLMENAPPNRGGEGVYKGVGGHLAAIAVKRSFETGGKGYTFLDAKTVLIEHYKKELGAKVLSGTRMFIDEPAAKSLYEKYFGEVKI